MKKIAITYGLLSGGIIAAIMGISIGWNASHPDLEDSMAFGYATMILGFVLIFVAVKVFRDKHNGGAVSFGKAFLLGLYITLIASTIYVAVWAIEYNYVFPDFMDKYASKMVNELKASGAAQAKIDAKMKEMDTYRDMYKNPFFFCLLTYAEILPVGLIVSLIAALVLKKRGLIPALSQGEGEVEKGRL